MKIVELVAGDISRRKKVKEKRPSPFLCLDYFKYRYNYAQKAKLTLNFVNYMIFFD